MAHVLVVEDEEAVRSMLRQILEREGHTVADAPDGREGFEAYRRRPADIVITDILMPQQGGLVLIGELTKAFPGVKILAISGGGRDGKLNFLATARTFPGVQTLKKPFSRAELVSALAGLRAAGAPANP